MLLIERRGLSNQRFGLGRPSLLQQGSGQPTACICRYNSPPQGVGLLRDLVEGFAVQALALVKLSRLVACVGQAHPVEDPRRRLGRGLKVVEDVLEERYGFCYATTI